MPKIIHYRDKCIGCGVCYEMQSEIWRMSRKDGKAVLLNATLKKETSILPIPEFMVQLSEAVACPVKIIKIV